MMKGILQVLVLMALLLCGCGEQPGEREFHQAMAQLERGRPVRARELLERSVQRRPGDAANAVSLHHLGAIAWQLGDLDAAGIYFERSHSKDATLFEPVFNLGVLAFQSEDWVRARVLFQSASQLAPRDPRPWEYLAATYVGPLGVREARYALFEAENRDPHSPRILTALARVEWEDGRTTRAISNLMRALEEDPAYAPALYNLARIAADTPNQRRNAISYYEQFLAVAQPSKKTEQAQRELILLRRTLAQPDPTPVPSPPEVDPIEEEEPEPAPPTLDEQIADATALAETGQVERATALFMRLASRLRQEGEEGSVEQVLRAGIDAVPDSSTLHAALGRHYAAEGRHGAAMRSFQRAANVDEDWAQPLILLATSAQELEQYDIAIDALARAVPLAPRDPSPLWALAEMYDHVGIQRRAIEAYEQFAERFPRDSRAVTAQERVLELLPPPPETPALEPEPEPAPLSALEQRRRQQAREALRVGLDRQRRGDTNGALFYFSRAVDHDPSLERAHFSMGWIELQQGNWDAARSALRQAAAIEPSNQQTWYLLAFAQHQLGERQQAIASLETAIQLNPDYDLAHLLLGNILNENDSQIPDAIRAYERFLEIAPDHDQAEAVRQWLARHR